jgi:site-specific DNA-methyltransferase (adenine-specific)
MVDLRCGDCLDVLRTLGDNSVDAVVTDPPYGLSFMGKKWDYDVPSQEVWAECLRVLKPGGHLLAFAGTRTQHRMAVRIEDAGFEIRDMIAWVYGSGFNKVGYIRGDDRKPVREGWAGSLKPALEPVTVARKPLGMTLAECVLAHGTGGLNIDGCRVEGGERPLIVGENNARKFSGDFKQGSRGEGTTTAGRWPANLIHDGSDEVMSEFPQAKGQQGAVTGEEPSSKTNAVYGQFNGRPATTPRGDSGSAARFFYCAKASKRDRDEGLEGFEAKKAGALNMRTDGHSERNGMNTQPRANTHVTVKPTDLMRYLCRLVTPPGGVVLDPFMGSGSTGKAAVLEGFQFIGIEREPEYMKIAEARINAVQPDLFGALA